MSNESGYFELDKRRLETSGINANMPLHYRFLMWQLIDNLRENIENVPLDYLQIFTFGYRVEQDGSITEIIEHKQEQPAYKAVYEFPKAYKGIKGKVYCIDDGGERGVCTMLWAEEY